jgi:hypothetical protein
MKSRLSFVALLCLPGLCGTIATAGGNSGQPYVRVSPRDTRYLELSDGKPYIPVGLNMIAPPGRDEGKALMQMEDWMRRLSANGGNYIRLWLSNPFFDVEHARSGVYDEEKAQRIDAVLALARQYNIRVKMTLEHFRHLGDGRQTWAGKRIYHVSQGGPAKDIADFFANPASREQFKRKLDWYAKRYGDDPLIFAWELWNEFDAVQDMWQPEKWREGGLALDWTRVMLDALHQRFPRNLCVQSLGSFDSAGKTQTYRTFTLIPENDLAQVHRYLDLGARLEVCHGPMDVLAADAVQTLLSFNAGKPVLLAESGAVEPSHSGPFKLYDKDKEGILLHDVLFAPFFTGAAGAGQCWHWDYYVAKNDLWFQFGRFAQAVKDLDPPAEGFRPVRVEHPRLRVYALVGQHTLLAWCRDAQNTWKTELAEGQAPEVLKDQFVTLPQDVAPKPSPTVRIYDPWTNTWSPGKIEAGKLSLPPFTRSIVFRMER